MEKRKPKTWSGRLGAGRWNVDKREVEDKAAELSSLLSPLFDKGERDTILILLLAGAHFLQGDTDRGQAVLKAGIEKHPKEIALHLQLAEATCAQAI